MAWQTYALSRSSSSQSSSMHVPVSLWDSNAPQQNRDASGHSSLSQLINNYTNTQMERDMESMLEEVAASRCSRSNGSGSTQETGSERPTKWP